MKYRFLAGLVGLAFGTWAGCTQTEGITHYTVPKTTSPSAGQASAEGDAAGTDRMLAAMILHGDQAWFFKATGPEAAVSEQARTFDTFLRSLKFGPSGQPSWTLPTGWREQPGSGMRFATLQFGPAEQPVELTVIPLPISGESEQEYVLSNVNRWRGQMGLAPLESRQLAASTTQFDLAGDPVTVVNLQGKLSSGGMGGPFAGGGGPFSGGGPAPAIGPVAPPERPIGPMPPSFNPAAQTSSAGDGLSYTVPEGWSPGQAGAMRKAAFEVTDGDKKVEITVIDLSAASGGTLANVNRWRQQIQLPAIDQAELDQLAQPIRVGQIEGTRVDLLGPESVSPRQAILGVIIPQADKTWFVKLMGDAELAQRQRAHFDSFVASLQLSKP